MTYEVGQLFYVREKFSVYERNGHVNYKLEKGQVAKIDGIVEHSAFSIRLKVDEKFYRFSIDEMKLYFYSQAEWREQQIDSILDD